jgi:hypothetical protein
MAIRLIEVYPNRVGAPTADYPHGVPRNKSTPTATDGTPFEQSWFRDQEGFFQGLMETAGITPSGTPDTVLNSDYLDALNRVTNGVIEVNMAGAADVALSTYQSRVAALKLTGALAADVDLIVPDTERMYWIIDETTGDFSVTVKTAAGTGVKLFGAASVVRSDGTNVVAYVNGADNRVIYVDTIADLQALDTSALVDGQVALVMGTEFRWDAAGAAWQIVGDITVEAFGAVCDGETDDSAAFQSAADFARDNDCSVIGLGNGAGYYLNSSVTTLYTSADIRAEVIFPADGGFRSIRVESTQTPDTIDFSTLSGLTEFSSQVTGLPSSAVGKYVWIESDEVLTERNNPPSNMPYEKRSAFYVSSDDGGISPSLDTTFNSGFTTTVTVFPEESRAYVKIAGLRLEGTGAANGSVILARDNTHLALGPVSAPDSEIRTIITVAANGCEVDCQSLNDAHFDGLGYGILISLSCNTILHAPMGASSRTELDGRHGANVTVNGGMLESAGSHWGNHYTFNNCHVGAYSWGGKDLSIKGGSYGAIYMRNDISLCIGRLSVKDTINTGKYISNLVPSSLAIAGFYSSPRRYFDYVEMDGIEMRGSGGHVYMYGGGGSANPEAEWTPPKSITVRNISGDREILGFAMGLDNATSLPWVPEYTFENIKGSSPKGSFLSVRGFVANASSNGIRIVVRDCGEFYFRVDASVIESLEIFDSTVTRLSRINGSTARGKIILNNCRYAPSSTSFTEARKEMINVVYDGNVTVGGGTDGLLDAQIGCRALSGATGYIEPLSYYVRSSVYEPDTSA